MSYIAVVTRVYSVSCIVYKLPEHNLVGSERSHKDRRPTSGATKEMLKDSTLSSHLSFISSFARPRDPLAIMPTLTVPATVTSPPYALLALALLKGCEIQWDLESGDRGEVMYDSVSGTQAVRAELEKGIPGKEVRQEDSSPKSKFRPEEPSHEAPRPVNAGLTSAVADPSASPADAVRVGQLVQRCAGHLQCAGRLPRLQVGFDQLASAPADTPIGHTLLDQSLALEIASFGVLSKVS